jgi:hypothetical protein
MLIFRLRFLLEITDTVPLLYPTHWALVYAVLSEANGLALKTKAALPEGTLLLAPERLRTYLEPRDHYAFGATILATSEASAAKTVARLTTGLEILGSGSRRRGKALSGNFRLVETRDLVANEALNPRLAPGGSQDLVETAAPRAIDGQQLLEQAQAVADREQLTLQFVSPLRCQVPMSRRGREAGQTMLRYFSRG